MRIWPNIQNAFQGFTGYVAEFLQGLGTNAMWVWPISTVLMGGAIVAGLATANLRRNPSAVEIDWRIAREPVKEVIVVPPTRNEIIQTITASGTVEPIEEADVASQIVGRVASIHVKEGDKVKRGDLLVKLDDIDARARLDSALARSERQRAAIALALADWQKAWRDVSRCERLASRGASPPMELEDARSALAKAQAAWTMSRNELAENEAIRRANQQILDLTEIRAPIDGVVAGLEVEVGEVVIAGTVNLPGTIMMTISDLDRTQLCADADESDVSLIQPGQVARVYLLADPRHPVVGTVDRIAPKGKKGKDGEVVTFETWVRVGTNHSALRAGMTATVEIEVRHADDTLGVPVQAVVHRRRRDLPDTPAVRIWAERNARSPGERAHEAELRYIKVVFVLEGGVARARPVETGISDERRVEILSGLKQGDRVIIGPFRVLDELKDGQPIQVVSDAED